MACDTRKWRGVSRTLKPLALVAFSVLFWGCATFPTFTSGTTTLPQVTNDLGQPFAQAANEAGANRVRWPRSTFQGASRSGLRIQVHFTFYDGEFAPDGTLRSWRAVNQNVSLNDSLGFNLPSDMWSRGYLTYRGKDVVFVEDRRAMSMTGWLPNYITYKAEDGTLYIGQLYYHNR